MFNLQQQFLKTPNEFPQYVLRPVANGVARVSHSGRENRSRAGWIEQAHHWTVRCKKFDKSTLFRANETKKPFSFSTYTEETVRALKNSAWFEIMLCFKSDFNQINWGKLSNLASWSFDKNIKKVSMVLYLICAIVPFFWYHQFYKARNFQKTTITRKGKWQLFFQGNSRKTKIINKTC